MNQEMYGRITSGLSEISLRASGIGDLVTRFSKLGSGLFPCPIWKSLEEIEIDCTAEYRAASAWIDKMMEYVPDDSAVNCLAFRLYELDSYRLAFMFTSNFDVASEDYCEYVYGGPSQAEEFRSDALDRIYAVGKLPREWHGDRTLAGYCVDALAYEIANTIIAAACKEIPANRLLGPSRGRYVVVGSEEPTLLGAVTAKGWIRHDPATPAADFKIA